MTELTRLRFPCAIPFRLPAVGSSHFRDGTPIIASVSEIDNLFSKGYITKQTRPLNDPLRYSICPVIKDPRDGGIARDQFLAYTRNPDGSPLEPEFLANFLSLQSTGRPAN